MTDMERLFRKIDEYHDTLGYPHPGLDFKGIMAETRSLTLAMVVEVVEALEATPWKPWRPEGYKPVDYDNLTEELVDILFFINSIRKLHKISWQEMQTALDNKVQENHARIDRGYNKIEPIEGMHK